MAKYNYTVINNSGVTFSGSREAKSKSEIYSSLTKQGLSVLTISLIKEKKDLNAYGWVSQSDLLLFTKNMATLLQGSLNIVDALEITQSQSQGKFKKILQDILQKIYGGQSLADGLSVYQNYFPASYIDVVRTGEISGNLAVNFNHLAIQLTKDQALRSKVITAMVYPIFVLASALGLGIILSTFVLPRLGRLFSSLEMNLPLATRVLLWFANLMRNYGILITLGIIALIILIRWLTRLNFVKPFFHRFILILPLVKTISQLINLARFSRSLGSLLKSGLPITEALKAVIIALDNVVYKKALQEVLGRIEKGSSLAEALKKRSKLFPKIATHLIAAGEETGQLEGSLFYLAEYYEDEVDNRTKNLSVVIEPALLIIIGAAVAFIGLSIVTPIYQITSKLGQ